MTTVIRPGGLIGRAGGVYGTIGAVVQCPAWNGRHVLTAGHVAAQEPASYDPLPRGFASSVGFDLGFIRVPDGLPISDTSAYPGARPITEIAEPVVGHAVYKDGAATGRTWGTITERRTDGLIVVRPLPVPPQGVVDFEISSAGDSGAVWRDVYTHAAVALHIAGDDREGIGYEAAYAIPMSVIQRRYGFEFYREEKNMADWQRADQSTNVSSGEITIQVVTVRGKPGDVMPVLRDLLAAQYGGGGP